MLNIAMAEEAICEALLATWDDADRPIIEWPNVTPPEPHPREGTTPWLALDIRHEKSDQATLGKSGHRVFTRQGSLTVRVFVPAGQRGLAEASSLAMEANSAYEGKTIKGVRFYRVGVQTVGRDEAWFQVNVNADFEFDEVK